MDKEVQWLTLGSGDNSRDIAVIKQAARPKQAGQGGYELPGLFWMSGFKSEMTSTKPGVLSHYAQLTGQALTRFDYSGHGRSGGRFEAGTISRWLEETEAVFCRMTTGRQLVIGSSMGGWLALLLAQKLAATAPDHAARLAGLVLIAPALDMTGRLMWDEFSPAQQQELRQNGRIDLANDYGDPYIITSDLIEDGRQYLSGNGPVACGVPLHIVQGMADKDVPWQVAVDLASRVDSPVARLTLLPGCDHRLSENKDLMSWLEVVGLMSHLDDPATTARAALQSST